MLMHLIKQEQQRLLAQVAQKPNQCQQTNPPSGPSRAFVTTSGKVIIADPRTLNNSNVQHKMTLQALATASKPATQGTSTVIHVVDSTEFELYPTGNEGLRDVTVEKIFFFHCVHFIP